MASGSFSGSAVNGQDPYLFWSYTQDVATRKTTLTLTLKIKRLDNNYTTFKNDAPYNIQCPNNTVAKSGTFDYDITDVSVGSYLTIASVVKTLQHGTDGVYGSGSVSMEGQLDLTGTSVGDLTTGVDTITIPDIPVESTVETVTGSTMGGTLGITLDAASSGFTHNLTYTFGSLTGTIINGLTGSLSPSYNWNTSALRDAMIQQSPSSASKSLTITCKTYSGSTLLGTTTKVVTLYVPSDAVPTISGVSNEDALQILGFALKTWYVQSKSKPKVLFQCAGYLGSSIVSRELKINGITVSNSLVGSFYEGTALSPIAFSSGNIFRITVTDSRGKTATTGDMAISQVAAYSIPGFTSCLVQRCLQDGTLNGDGTWLKITPNWYFSSVVAASVARNAIATKNWKIGAGANTVFSSGDGVSFIVSNGIPAGADGKFAINSSYLITVTITDTLGGSALMAITVPSAKRLLSLNSAGTGVAVGKAAEVGSADFEVALPLLMKADLTLERDTAVSPGPYTKGLYSIGSAGTGIFTLGRNLYDNLLINHGSIGNVYTYAPVDKKIYSVIKDAGGANTYPLVVSAGQVDITGDLLANNASFLPQVMTFNFVTASTVVVQASKEVLAYYYPALKIGFIRAFCGVGTSGWALNTVVTIGTLLNPTGKNIPTQPLFGARSYAWAGIVEPTLVDVASGAEIRITMKNAAATSGMNIYIAGMFLVE